MVIDFHTHIFPKGIRENREAYFASEPAFKLLYSLPGSKLVGAQEIVAAMDRQGVDKSVIFGFPWKKSQTFIKHNDYIDVLPNMTNFSRHRLNRKGSETGKNRRNFILRQYFGKTP
jgi:hypothetical protein